jgi:hypothetical protein
LRPNFNISYSAISTYEKCPYRFKRQYIHKIKIDAPQLRIGRAVHTICEKIIKKEITSKKIPSVILELLEDDEERKEALKIIGGNRSNTFIKDLKLDEAYKVVSEEEINIENDGVNYKGIIDVQVKYNKNSKKELTIVDFKTSKNTKYEYVDWLQFEFYAYLIALKLLNDGKIIPDTFNCIIYFLRYNSFYEKKIKRKHLNSVHLKITNLKDMILRDEYFKPRRNPFCKYKTGQCPFYDECPLFLNLI